MSDEIRRPVVAERAARAGGAVARGAFRGALSVSTKADETDLVTDVDVDAQAQIVSTLVEAFPSDPILAEEDANVPTGLDVDVQFVDEIPARGPCWVVDPIDGTTNFVGGIGLWTACVAAVLDGDPVAAATYFPVAGEMYTAGPDGADRDGTTLSVSARTAPAAFVVAPIGRVHASSADQFGAVSTAAIERFGDLRRFGSMQATLAFVAAGGLDAAFSPARVNPWDAVGGVHLVRRAGGTVTDLDGERWTHESDSLVASNGEAHDVIREVAGTSVGG